MPRGAADYRARRYAAGCTFQKLRGNRLQRLRRPPPIRFDTAKGFGANRANDCSFGEEDD